MKISFYFDTYNHQKLEHIYATQTPGKKMKNVTRYKVTVEIPDPLDKDCDTELFPEAEKIEDDATGD